MEDSDYKACYDGEDEEGIKLECDLTIPLGTEFHRAPIHIDIDADEWVEAVLPLSDDESMFVLIPKSYFNK